jgi:hypothetical protein
MRLMYRFGLFIFLVAPLASWCQLKLVIETSVSSCKFAAGTAKNSTNQTEANPLLTLNGRVSIEKRLAGSMFFSAGAAFDTRGGRLLMNQGRADYSDKTIIINYLSLPLGVFTKLALGKKDLFLGANIYAAWPVRGYEKGIQGSMGAPVIIYNRLKIGSANNDPTQLHPTVVSGSDYGAETFAQIRIKNLRLGFRYTRGLKGILINAGLYDRQYYNTGVALTIAYQL